jgi:hypothetical protein
MPAYDLSVLFSNLPRRDPFANRRLGKAYIRTLKAYAAGTGLDPRWLRVLVPVGMMRFVIFCASEDREEPLGRTLARLESLARHGYEALASLSDKGAAR